MKKEEEQNRNGKGGSNFEHLKWPAIIMGVLIVLLIVSFDYCSRSGNL